MKCVQVEDHICLTGGEDGNIRLWDLRRVDVADGWGDDLVSLSDVPEEEEESDGQENNVRDGRAATVRDHDGSCARLLEGHTKAVTALYFEDECLVRGFVAPSYSCH